MIAAGPKFHSKNNQCVPAGSLNRGQVAALATFSDDKSLKFVTYTKGDSELKIVPMGGYLDSMYEDPLEESIIEPHRTASKKSLNKTDSLSIEEEDGSQFKK